MPQDDPGDIGDIATTETGDEYFTYGKYRIKITEHFAAEGKPLGDLLEEAIYHEAKEKVIKIA